MPCSDKTPGTAALPDFAFVADALDGMCVGLVLTNAAGRVTWSNRAAQAILAFDAAEALGRPLAQLLRDPNMVEFWHAAIASDAVAMGNVSLHWPVARQIKANSTRCLDLAGGLVGRALLFCDVTQEHNLQLQLSAAATQRLLDLADQHVGDSCPVPYGGLTAQELRVLRLVGRGRANKEIAREVHLAETTVRTHLKHLYGKLGLQSRSEAIAYALRHGLT